MKKPIHLLILFLVCLLACKQIPSTGIQSGLVSSPEPGMDAPFNFNTVEDLEAYFTYSPGRAYSISAHRGGHFEDYPENCLEAFEHMLSEKQVMIEMDVQTSKDGVLHLMHDNSIDRTTDGSGRGTDLLWEEMDNLKLINDDGSLTEYEIPLFSEILSWAKGKTILFIDIKREVPYEQVLDEIAEAGAEAYCVVITYSIGAAKKIHRLNPDVLLSISARNQEEWEKFKESGIPFRKMVAFTGTRRSDDSLFEDIHAKGVCAIMGTMGNIDKQAQSKGGSVYVDLRNQGVDIFATDYPLEVIGSLSN
ncbi:MAG: glycerophosphodiester phosphodiesterase family protein [Bacteroidota bacterium]